VASVDRLPNLDVSFVEDPRVVKQAATEDYSLHIAPRSWRSGKWSLAMAWWGMCSGMFFLIVGGTLALAVGSRDALIGLALTAISFAVINSILQGYAARTGTTVALFSRTLFGYMGGAIAPLIFGATAVYYTVFEGSVIAAAFQAYFGGSIKVWYLVVILYSMPLVIGGIRVWLDKLNGFLLPFYLLGLVGSVVWAISSQGYSDRWLTFMPESTAGVSGPGWLFAYVIYMGVWIMMMYTWDYGRFGKVEDRKFHSVFTFGAVFSIFSYFINGAVGIFLAHTIETPGGLTEVSAVISLVSMMGIFGLIFVWVSQTRINTANLYLASANMESFFSRVFKIKLNRLWWVLFCGIAAYVIMLTNVFSYILRALSWQGVFVVAWVGIALTTIAFRKMRGGSADSDLPEFRPGRLRRFSPGLVAWLISSAVGIALVETGGSFGATWSPPITLGLAVGLQLILLSTVSTEAWELKRPHDPRAEVNDVWEARIRCHECDRSYISVEMDRDPSNGHKPICAGCASESSTFYHAACQEALAYGSTGMTGEPSPALD